MPDSGEIVFCEPNKMECVLEDKVSGSQESCYVITCVLCKFKIIPVTFCFKCIAVSRGNVSLLYINRFKFSCKANRMNSKDKETTHGSAMAEIASGLRCCCSEVFTPTAHAC